MNRKVYRITAFLLLCSFLLSSCKENKKQVQQPELLEPVNSVEKTEKATVRDIFNVRTYNLTVVPESKIIGFKQDGIFDKYEVAIGDKVKKGQILATQNNESYQKDLEELEKSYDDLKNSYEDNKKINELGIKILNEKLTQEKNKLKQATEEEKEQIQYNIDKLKLDYKSQEDAIKLSKMEYEAGEKSLRNQIQSLKETMVKNSITAPFDGIIAYEDKIETGSAVAGNQPIIRILDTSKTYLACEMTDTYLFSNATGYYALINGKKYDINYEEATFAYITDESGVFQNTCRFTLKKKENDLKYGDTGLLCLYLKNKEKVLSVSNKCVYPEGDNKFFVYRINGDEKEKVYVETGITTVLYTEIISGLKEGDVVVAE